MNGTCFPPQSEGPPDLRGEWRLRVEHVETRTVVVGSGKLTEDASMHIEALEAMSGTLASRRSTWTPT